MTVLMDFYKSVKPWGFWKPVHEEVIKTDPSFEANNRFKWDMFNVLVGTTAQTAITALPVFIVLMLTNQILITALVLTITVLILWKTWYKHLPKD
jgi:hypothetical protein